MRIFIWVLFFISLYGISDALLTSCPADGLNGEGTTSVPVCTSSEVCGTYLSSSSSGHCCDFSGNSGATSDNPCGNGCDVFGDVPSEICRVGSNGTFCKFECVSNPCLIAFSLSGQAKKKSISIPRGDDVPSGVFFSTACTVESPRCNSDFSGIETFINDPSSYDCDAKVIYFDGINDAMYIITICDEASYQYTTSLCDLSEPLPICEDGNTLITYNGSEICTSVAFGEPICEGTDPFSEFCGDDQCADAECLSNPPCFGITCSSDPIDPTCDGNKLVTYISECKPTGLSSDPTGICIPTINSTTTCPGYCENGECKTDVNPCDNVNCPSTGTITCTEIDNTWHKGTHTGCSSGECSINWEICEEGYICDNSFGGCISEMEDSCIPNQCVNGIRRCNDNFTGFYTQSGGCSSDGDGGISCNEWLTECGVDKICRESDPQCDDIGINPCDSVNCLDNVTPLSKCLNGVRVEASSTCYSADGINPICTGIVYIPSEDICDDNEVCADRGEDAGTCIVPTFSYEFTLEVCQFPHFEDSFVEDSFLQILYEVSSTIDLIQNFLIAVQIEDTISDSCDFTFTIRLYFSLDEERDTNTLLEAITSDLIESNALSDAGFPGSVIDVAIERTITSGSDSSSESDNTNESDDANKLNTILYF